jgi:hypothetical protein
MEVFITFPNGFITLSAFPLPWGHNGVLVFHSIPKVAMYLSKLFPLKGGPLSVLIFFGIP